MAYRIQVRRDTAINWTNTNPILASGEMGLETDTRKFKFGDGTTAWNLLVYAVDAAGVSSVNAKTGDVVLTTDDIGAVPDRQYVTEEDLVKLGNLSGTNTGDQDLSSLLSKNVAITGATKTKITYDANGLVTSGNDATTADIAASTDKNYVTDAQLTVIGNTSGTNTGDQDLSSYMHKLGQEIIVATSGGDFTSVKSAIESITDASATKQYTISVKPGTYIEAPFSMKQFVSIVGSGGYYNTILKTNDNNAHFITSIDKSEIVNVSLEGPTGVGYATVNHTVASYSPFKLINIAIRAGYYGVWCHPATSTGVIHAFNVVNWYSGSATSRLFYATDYGNITSMSSGWMSGAPGKCSYGFACDGANATMTLDLCFFRNGAGAVNPIAIFADNGSTVRLTAFTASEADTAIKIGTVGATTIHAVSCVLKDEVTNHIDIGSATATLEFSGAADNTKISVANGAKFSAMFSDTATDGEEGTRILGELWLGTTNAAIPLREYGLKTYYSGWISGGVCTKSATALRSDVTAGSGFINNGVNAHAVSWNSGYVDLQDNTAQQCIYVDSTGTIQAALTAPDTSTNIILSIGDTANGDIIFLADHRIPIAHYISSMTSYLENVVGPISTSGCVTSIHGSTKQLDVTNGVYQLYHVPISITGGTPIDIHTLYRNGSGGWVHTTGITEVNTAKYDNGSGTLVDVPSGKYKKDLLFATKIGDNTYYHLVYGQEVFDNKSLAETGNNPISPTAHMKYALRLAGVVSLANASTIESIVDQRPKLGQMAGSVASISDHGELTGLSDDDHVQYFNQTRGDARYALTSQIVTNGNNHDHVGGDGAQIAYGSLSGIPSTFTAAAHAATHITGGGDTIANVVAAGASGLMSGSDKTKLDGIASGAEVNVNADWNAVSGDAQILNKPTTMTPSSHDNTAHSTAYATASDVSTHTGDSTIHFTQAAIDHTNITNKGTNTHAQIDTFIGTKAAASGLASLNASTKVVQDPANATGTSTAFKIPIADGSGKLDSWITTGSQRGQATTSVNITPLALSSAGSGSLDAKDDHTHRGPGGIASRTSTIAVANVETVILTATLPANFMQTGTTFRVRATGVGTSGATAGTSIWRVRIGTSTLGNIATSVSVANAANITAGSFIVEGMVVVRSGGAGGTIIGDLSAYGNETTRIFTNRVNLSSVTSTVGVDCTASNLLELTLVSGNSGTTFTTHLATFEVVMM